MMKASVVALAVAGMLLTLMLTVAQLARGETNNFIISGADAISYVGMAPSSTLNSLISGVGPRFTVQYANGIRFYSMTPVSAELQTALGQVGDKFTIQYANANRYYGFAYPVGLIGDTTPPEPTGLVSTTVGPGQVTISWTTEFATHTLEYGTQPGVYTQTVTENLYYRLHEVALSGLKVGGRYYFRFSNTDRSGNTYQSPEYSLDVRGFTFLPILRKNS